MEIKQLESELMVAEKPESPEQLYSQMTTTSLDFRALAVPEDWLDQLWDLVYEVRKILPTRPPMPPGASAALAAELKPMMPRLGLKFKNPAESARSDRKRKAVLEGHYNRLMQIRRNAWFDVKLETVDVEVYRMYRKIQVHLLSHRLRALEALLPTADHSHKTAADYLKMMTFWQTLERPSVEEEREEALDVLVQFRLMESRTKRYFNERDRIIFLCEEPVIQIDPSEPDELRAGVLRELEEIGKTLPDE